LACWPPRYYLGVGQVCVHASYLGEYSPSPAAARWGD
jgi:hypothetical protein